MSHYQGGGAVVGQIPPGQQQQAQAVHHQQQQQQQQLHYQGQPQPHAVHMQQGVYPHQMVPQQAPPQPQQQQQHHAHHQQVQQYQPQPQSQPQQQQQQAVSRVHPQQAHQAQAQVQQQQPPSSQQQQQQHQQAAQQAVAQQHQQIAGGGIQEMPARIGQHLESIRGEFDRLLGEYQATASQRARGGAGSGAIDSDLEQKLVQQINELGGVQAAVNVIGRRVDEAQRDYNLTVAQYQLQNLEKVAPNLSAIIMNAQPPDLSNVSMDIYQSVVPNGPSTGPPTQEQLKQQQQQQWSSYNQNYLQAHGTPAPPIGHQQGPNQLGYQQMQQHYRAIQHQQAQMQQQQQQQPQQTPVIGQQQPQQRIHPQMQQAPLQQQQQPQQQGMQPQQQPFMQQGQAPSQYGQQQRQPTPRQSQQIAVPPQQQQPQQQGRGPVGGQSQQMQYGAAAPQPGMEPNGVQGGSEQVGSIRPGRAGSRGNAMNISMSLADYDVTQLSSSHYREHGDWHVIYNPTKGEPVVEIEHMHTLVHNGVVCCVKFSKDGKLMAAGSNRMAMLYEVPSFHLLREITEPFTWNNHPDGNINNNNDNNDPNIGNQAADLYVRAVCFSPDSKLLATGSEDRLVRIIEVATGNVLRVMQGHTSDIYALDFSTDGRLLLSGSGDCTAMVWDVNSGTRLHVLHVQSSPQDEQDCGVPSVAFSRDGYLVAAASLDKIIRLWNLSIQHNPVIERIAGHNDSVYSIAFAHHGNTLVSGSLDKTIKLWDLTALLRNQYDPSNGNNAMRQQGSMHPATIGGASLLGTLLGHKDFVLSVEFTFDDKYIISGSKDRTVQIWDSSTHEALALLSGHKDSVIGIGLNPAQPMFATASGDCKMKIWTYQSSSSSNAAKDVKPNINPTPAPPPQQQQQQQQQQ